MPLNNQKKLQNYYRNLDEIVASFILGPDITKITHSRSMKELAQPQIKRRLVSDLTFERFKVQLLNGTFTLEILLNVKCKNKELSAF